MRQPRRDTRGIVDPGGLLRRVRFRRHAPAAELAGLLEHYWFIDWDLTEPFEQSVIGHPSVNLVVMRATGDDPVTAEIAGVSRTLFSIKLTGTGWVRGVKFRPGGFRPFFGTSPAAFTDRRVPLGQVLADDEFADRVAAATEIARSTEAASDAAEATSAATEAADAAAVAVLDNRLLALRPQPDEPARLAMELVDRVRADRSIRRVDEFARAVGMSTRSLQRLFIDHVGVTPKWVILRYRIHEVIERAAGDVDWNAVVAELGYSDQAHLVRDVTATIGVSPTAYAASIR
ncbi:DUF6597 domain-containing transcriptional factor [Plantactinospora sp. GCM10030261]|uniref:DUF6597 domain-containing transcriptional factor n=1 Tax=Plantactinospora sp. GCM10030261 TaxID=3273420 RepID=UPI00360A987D